MTKPTRIRDASSYAEWFWARVDKGPEGQCWPWSQSLNPGGYGQAWDGKTIRPAHRVAWELARGPILNGLQINHTCDNRKCCNPAHLYCGTQKQNIRDVVERKRRSWAGEHHPAAKLTDEQALEIRRRVASGETYRSVGDDYGIHKKTVAWVCKYGWKHLNNDQ